VHLILWENGDDDNNVRMKEIILLYKLIRITAGLAVGHFIF
jgi:hypothetical protein